MKLEQWTHIGTQSLGANCPKLAQICDAWDSIPEHLKEAILLISAPYLASASNQLEFENQV